MKRIISLTTLALLLSGNIMAKNTVTTVSQVTESVQLTTDVDYTITGTTPFGAMGSVDIQNTEHAVLILKNVKPSQCIATYLPKIFINGEAAANGKNCQVKMYAGGCIILPYGDSFKPLTCYTEKNYGGESYNNYTTGHSGGYMKTLNKTALNNQIRSFKLKRGYMVTFAVGTGGWGYSRCFIAADQDLEMSSLPNILDGRISSYRLFKWLDASKKGLASDGNGNTNALLNTTWCYDWGQGNTSLLPDVEWVPNHIYEDWPSTSAIGGRDGTCHTKANNEPANSADDHPQSVEEVLNNWQNMMRTGLRLCSPATHDGGWGWHDEFMKAIDARGWRCDIVDFHGYWDGEWGSLDWRIDRYAYERPVWFSEWVWGASWNNNGIFGQAPDGKGSFSTRNQQKCYDGTKPILDRLNSNSRVERYAYWNSEADASKIYHYGNQTLSILGKYYADMEVDLAYKGREFIPKEPTLTAVNDLAATHNRTSGVVTFTWTEAYGDLVGSITLQRKKPGSGTWEDVQTIEPQDQNGKSGVTMTATDNLKGAEPGEYEYRVKDMSYANKPLTSNTVSVSISSQMSAGVFNFGNAKVPVALDIANLSNNLVYASLEGQDAAPLAFLGLPTYKNKTIGVTSFLNGVSKTQIKFGAMLWKEKFTGSYTNTETMDYLTIPEGTYQYGDMQIVAGMKATVGDTEVEVTFPTPFPEGDSVVVICQLYHTNMKYGTVPRVTDVTNTGFKVRHIGQKAQTSIAKKTMYYIAASKGQCKIGDGYMLSVGTSDKPVGGKTTYNNIMFDRYTPDGDGLQHDTLQLSSPIILCGPQTDRLPELATTFRINTTIVADATTEDGSTYSATRGLNIIRQVDASNDYKGTNSSAENGDIMGWMCISIDTTPDTPDAVKVIKSSTANGTRTIYSLDGKRMADGQLNAGVYIIRDGSTTRKIVVK